MKQTFITTKLYIHICIKFFYIFITADNIDYNDGDFQSSSKYLNPDFENRADRMYDYGKTTLINNRSRVYKGGSWEDRVYYNIPSTRRFMDERKSSRSLGFRCAMDRVGSPSGIGAKGGE